MPKPKAVFVPGGAGFIGSHVVTELLLKTPYNVLVVDNLSNATPNKNDKKLTPPSLERVQQIVKNHCDQNNNEFSNRLEFIYNEYHDENTIESLHARYEILATIIVAGSKAVGESKSKPLLYYKNNVCKTVDMLEILGRLGLTNIIFSSSATVYDPLQKDEPLLENMGTGAGLSCAYGRTKYFIEEILKDLAFAEKRWNCVSLRYFNPVGAHPSGLIGEDPQGVPNNLMPMIAQVAVGRRPKLSVFGNDYDTPDGTGIRDYLHVVDLAKAHVQAVDLCLQGIGEGFKAINLGSGSGYSVLEVIASFEKASEIKLNWEFAPRREGDVTRLYCDPIVAEKEIGWKTTKTLDEMCADMWNFQKNNPYGYADQKSNH